MRIVRSRIAAAAALLFVALAARDARAQAADADSALVFPRAADRAWQVGLVRSDRLQHASLSFTLAAGSVIGGASPARAFWITAALGVAKECFDARHDRFDPVDVAADLAGALSGASAARARR